MRQVDGPIRRVRYCLIHHVPPKATSRFLVCCFTTLSISARFQGSSNGKQHAASSQPEFSITGPITRESCANLRKKSAQKPADSGLLARPPASGVNEIAVVQGGTLIALPSTKGGGSYAGTIYDRNQPNSLPNGLIERF